MLVLSESSEQDFTLPSNKISPAVVDLGYKGFSDGYRPYNRESFYHKSPNAFSFSLSVCVCVVT
jgi:hypothetical protein